MKYYDCAVTFAEFPREIALCLEISNCPNNCPHCSEPWLLEDVGTILDREEIKRLVDSHPGITLIGFMGGDRYHEEIAKLSEYIHSIGLKVGFYSGQDALNLNLVNIIDYYKIGRWIMFEGPQDTWKYQTAGPICLPTSNQIMFMRDGNKLIDVTQDFRKNKINDWSKTIIGFEGNKEL